MIRSVIFGFFCGKIIEIIGLKVPGNYSDRFWFNNLQATASAADPFGIRRIDVWIQSALVSSVSSAGQIIGRPVVVRQLDSVINRMQQFDKEEWHSDLDVHILSNLASISARFNSSDGTTSVETQTV